MGSASYILKNFTALVDERLPGRDASSSKQPESSKHQQEHEGQGQKRKFEDGTDELSSQFDSGQLAAEGRRDKNRKIDNDVRAASDKFGNTGHVIDTMEYIDPMSYDNCHMTIKRIKYAIGNNYLPEERNKFKEMFGNEFSDKEKCIHKIRGNDGFINTLKEMVESVEKVLDLIEKQKTEKSPGELKKLWKEFSDDFNNSLQPQGLLASLWKYMGWSQTPDLKPLHTASKDHLSHILYLVESAGFNHRVKKLEEDNKVIEELMGGHTDKIKEIGYDYWWLYDKKKEPEKFQEYLDKYYKQEYHPDVVAFGQADRCRPAFKRHCEIRAKIRGQIEDLEANWDMKVSEREERIEKRLKELPQMSPTLEDLPQEQWWKLYSDGSMHKEAQKQGDSGHSSDIENSPGYHESMKKLYKDHLVNAQHDKQESMNYDDYTKIHDIVIEHLPTYKRYKMGQPASYESHSLGNIDYNETQERVKAFQEMQEERINDLPLFENLVRTPESVVHPSNLPSKAITVGRVRYDYHPHQFGEIIMDSHWPAEAGPRHVNTILESYYQGREQPNQTKHQRLREIARTVRALHVMRPKVGGNEQTHIFLLNKWLVEEGFSSTILPNGFKVFEGVKTIDGIVKDMVEGMHSFKNEVDKSSKSKN